MSACDSPDAEHAATLAGEVLVQSGDWQRAATHYQDLERHFPESENLDRFTLFQGLALFQKGKLKQAARLFAKMLKNHPNSPLAENASYYPKKENGRVS